MSKENWTPGPWSYGHGIDAVYDENGVRVCAMTGDVARATHDARLIAAAPDLYEALEAMLEFPNCGPSHSFAKAALKKARGES